MTFALSLFISSHSLLASAGEFVPFILLTTAFKTVCALTPTGHLTPLTALPLITAPSLPDPPWSPHLSHCSPFDHSAPSLPDLAVPWPGQRQPCPGFCPECFFLRCISHLLHIFASMSLPYLSFLKNIFFQLFIWLCWVLLVACRIFHLRWSFSTWDLVPWAGIQPRAPVLGAQSISHWTTGKISALFFLIHPIKCCCC